MSTTPSRGPAVVVGAGPGLGMSVARRLGRAGHTVALVSRNAARHPGYVAELAAEGLRATAHAADARDLGALSAAFRAIADRHGPVEVLYFGPGAADPAAMPAPITRADVEGVREAVEGWVYPAVAAVGEVLPGMLELGRGGLLFAGGLSGVVPMPPLGALAVSSAALRGYVLTLNAGLAGTGVYAGLLTIGGLVERGDIHRMITSRPGMLGDLAGKTLDPDEIAEAAWGLLTKRDEPEATFSALG
ncbi:SDR family NAD(P)-dependent oxidoreductase [Nonomuraea sp. SMC257]|uniref:SDR family NAD(P)-dependent oxidoreductase n=1 Tax=Nonomuraea montanisoli TaxID=2741721 RepID=A0A7Y6I5R1_9ACTN|nr:SDR family NAD(P)-dependent oxidoreductase [Nonomuraea montanisoli]NUW30969.1 SDR family NAD(P)-dependent oxidoreductase [Nonomuraea montanisoli]